VYFCTLTYKYGARAGIFQSINRPVLVPVSAHGSASEWNCPLRVHDLLDGSLCSAVSPTWSVILSAPALPRAAAGRKSGQHMGRPSKLTEAQKAEARRRRAEGATLAELARSYDVGKRIASKVFWS
jgi:hypothetical protein